MASYTMQVREIINHYSQYQTNLTSKEKLKIGIDAFFKDIEYPIFNEDYRKTFQENFIRYFYFREIGFETEYQFKFRLESWLKLNMPYFNKLFESEMIKYDPLKNINISTNQDVSRENNQDAVTTNTGEKTGLQNNHQKTVTDNTSHDENNTTLNNTSHGTNKNTTNVDGFKRDLESDTPDSRLAITTNDGQGVIEYASKINESTNNDVTTNDSTSDDTLNSKSNSISNGTSNTTTNSDGTVDMKENSLDKIIGNITGSNSEVLTNTRSGKDGSITYQQMILELRQTFIRIEKMIFDEMNKELFMLIY